MVDTTSFAGLILVELERYYASMYSENRIIKSTSGSCVLK